MKIVVWSPDELLSTYIGVQKGIIFDNIDLKWSQKYSVNKCFYAGRILTELGYPLLCVLWNASTLNS